jgi:EAL domain-containing protein (putative c-di-GMP-specific phosphodiesterase class I)/CheY-like chemotaxis protein
MGSSITTPGRAISIVVADDEPHVVAYLEAVLHTSGFVVAGTAADADGAVQAVHHLEPDVVLLDLHMPGGGLEAARLIGAVRPGTRIVIFSAAVDEVLPLLRSGVDGYVVKGSHPDQLVEAIRSAMTGGKYLAPQAGRVAVDELRSRLDAEEREALRHRRVRDRLAATIADQRFSVVVQPMVDLGTDPAAGSPTVAVEALARFPDPPLRPPDEWFADADEAGLRVPLELAAAGVALGLLPALRSDLCLAINVGPATVLSGRLPEILTGRPLDRVILEVTEHAVIGDYRSFDAVLAPWRTAGLRVAVDDAGGGYASFAHILSLSPDIIKVEASITQDIQLDKRRQAMARALVGFARELDLIVVAEGVETAGDLEVLQAMGVHWAQGFHVGRPRALAEQPELCAGAVTPDLRIDLVDPLGFSPRRG